MRTLTAVKSAGLVAAAAVLGLLAVPGTYALWNAVVYADPGTVRAADFTVYLTGSHSTGIHDMVLADGSPATVSLTSTAASLGELYPGASVYAGVRIDNATEAGSDFTVLAGPAGPAVVTDTGPGTGLSSYLDIRPAPATGLEQCPLVPDSVYLESFTGVRIPKGGSGVICFRIQLSAQAPSGVQGQSASIAVPLRVEQIL
jgi:predicted ribosomally synthesized peptide with SipW-like signal peptide